MPVVLPREKFVPARPARAQPRQFARLSCQAQIAQRDDTCARSACKRGKRRFPPPVSERVELFDIAELKPGLAPDPFAQADLERAVSIRIERAEGQGRFRRCQPLRDKHAWLAFLAGDNHRVKADN